MMYVEVVGEVVRGAPIVLHDDADLADFFPAEFIKRLVPVEAELEGVVSSGWTYRDGNFSEPPPPNERERSEADILAEMVALKSRLDELIQQIG